MSKFRFYRDTKYTIWGREEFEIEADNKEEALKKLINNKVTRDEFLDDRLMKETLEYLTTDENLDQPTECIYDDDTDEELYNNYDGVNNDIFSNFPEESV